MEGLLGIGLTAALSCLVLTESDAGSTALSPGSASIAARLFKIFEKVGKGPVGFAVSLWSASERMCREAVARGGSAFETIDRARGAYAFALVLSGVPFAFLVWSLAAYPLGPCLFLAVTAFHARRLKEREAERLEKEIPDVLRTMATSLASGQTLTQAITHVGSRDFGQVSRAFSRAGFLLSCGGTVADALRSIESELSAPGIDMLVMALDVSRRTGAPLQSLLLRSAELVESQTALRQTLQAKTAQVRLSARIVMLLPCLLVMCLVLISSDFREGLVTPVGIACMVLAAFLDTVAFFVMKGLMRQVGL